MLPKFNASGRDLFFWCTIFRKCATWECATSLSIIVKQQKIYIDYKAVRIKVRIWKTVSVNSLLQNILAYDIVIYEPMSKAYVKFKESLPRRFLAIHERKIKTFSYYKMQLSCCISGCPTAAALKRLLLSKNWSNVTMRVCFEI